MRRFLNYFLRGLVLLAPVGITVWVISKAFLMIDGWLDLPWPGAGFAATVAIITLFGFVASNLIATQLVALFDGVLQRVPLVRLVYSSAKDLLNAFVGEKRRFKTPVVVTIVPGGNVRCLGFITTLLRGTEWAATGKVTLPIPENFPGPDKVSTLAK